MMQIPPDVTLMPVDEEAAALVADMDARARRIETPSGDGTMTWRVWGEGRPVILSHGSQGSWLHWVRNIDALAREYRVIAIDFPGHGDSALPPDRTHAGLAQVLGQGLPMVLQPGEKADLVGFSFGGVQLTHLAATFPEFVRRLILVGVGGLDTPMGEISLTSLRGFEGDARVAAHTHNLLELMLHDPKSVDALALHVQEANVRAVQYQMRDYQVLPDWVLQALPDVRAQVDSIWGECDNAHPDAEVQAEAMRVYKPDLEMHVIPGAGHWAMFEQADAFNATLLDMLRRPLRSDPAAG